MQLVELMGIEDYVVEPGSCYRDGLSGRLSDRLSALFAFFSLKYYSGIAPASKNGLLAAKEPTVYKQMIMQSMTFIENVTNTRSHSCHHHLRAH